MLNPAYRVLICLVWLASAVAHAAPVKVKDPVQQGHPSQQGNQELDKSFVKREGARLSLNDESYYFSGANQYYIFYKSRQMVDEVLEDAASMGLNTLRTWAFCDGQWHDGYSLQPKPRVYDENTFQNLDYAVYKAKQLGIKLVLTLVNNWDAFGGMSVYVDWSPTALSHDDFYSDPETRAIYRDYIKYLLNRTNIYTQTAYKDEPAILMWELANEPRVERSRAPEFYSWVHEMAAYIKSIDPNHLVSTGSEGDISTDLVLTHQSPYVDVASFHLYPEDWGMDEEGSIAYIKRQVRSARQSLNKPVYVGELGRRDKGTRDAIYKRWYDVFAEENIDGAMFWLLSGHQDNGTLYPDFDGFTVYYPESSSTVSILQEHSKSTHAKSKIALDLTLPEITIIPAPSPARGQIKLQGTASDDQRLDRVELNFGGGFRPAQGRENWTYNWDSTSALDGSYRIRVRAVDHEGNTQESIVALTVDNNSPKQGDWQLQGEKSQDDGFNLVYHLSAKNQTASPAVGQFVFRYFLAIDGPLKFGSHYESSDVYEGDPKVSSPQPLFGELSYYDIDLGERLVAPGESIGFKGHFNQSDGQIKSHNDWTNLPAVIGPVQRVQLLLNGKPIAGYAP